ncbi:MAG: hypothetical protein JW976_13855 [Syntrophaceae bacterium]|nr:hypothetical protein [Syntrophaceae bacterium]
MNVLRPLFKYLIIPAILIWFGAFLNARYAERKQLTIPTTVYDARGNKLHLEEPQGRDTYYEYPIILYDKANNTSRIDMYSRFPLIAYLKSYISELQQVLKKNNIPIPTPKQKL